MSELLPDLPERDIDAHKGMFGRIQIIGGSAGMAGAPALAAQAALRSGAGLVQVVCPESVRHTIATLVPCATTSTVLDDGRYSPNVRAIGPGSGDTLSGRQVAELLAPGHGAGHIPVIVDADGLNALARTDHWWEHCSSRIVLTPHPGEMSRLLDRTALDTPLDRRSTVAQELARLAGGCTLVLKGHGTVVSNGQDVYVNDTGNPGMATGGSGDVLTGVIAGLLGQRMSPFDAARLGVYLHGLAGDIAVKKIGQISLTAEDLVAYLPDAFQRYRLS